MVFETLGETVIKAIDEVLSWVAMLSLVAEVLNRAEVLGVVRGVIAEALAESELSVVGCLEVGAADAAAGRWS